MKKIIYVTASLSLMLFVGCSKDNSTEPNNDLYYYPKTVYERNLDEPSTDLHLSEEFIYDDSMRLIRINEYSHDGSLNQYREFEYNNNNYVSRIDEYSIGSNKDEHEFSLFIYENNVLAQRENYSINAKDDVLDSYQTFEYEEGKCIKAYYFGSDSKEDYYAHVIYAYDTNGNIVHYTYISDDEINEKQYNYDNYNYWMKNITPTFLWKFPFYIPVNNVTNEYNDYSEFVSTFEYNDDDYPTKITIQRYWNGNYDPGESSEMQIEYEIK